MNILVSVNKKYVRYLLVLMASAYVNHPGESVTFYVLGRKSELDKQTSKEIERYAQCWNQKAIILYIEEDAFQGYKTESNWTVEVYYRLLAHELLPETMERILYLDVDMVIDRNISEYYRTDFKGNYLVCCRGASDTLICLDGGDEEEHCYFNSGNLLMNLPLFRENVAMQTYEDYIASRGGRYFQDEGILNGVFKGKVILKHPYDYNCYPAFYPKYVRRLGFEPKPSIIHYAVGSKPWDYWDGRAYLQGRWWHYAQMTPYYTPLLEEMRAKREYRDRVVSKISDKVRYFHNDRDKWRLYSDIFRDLILRREQALDALSKAGYESAAIYGFSELTHILYDILTSLGVRISYIVTDSANQEYPVPYIKRSSSHYPDVSVMVIADVLNESGLKKKFERIKPKFPVYGAREFLNIDETPPSDISFHLNAP